MADRYAVFAYSDYYPAGGWTRRGFIGGLLAGLAATQVALPVGSKPVAPLPVVGEWWDVLLERKGTCQVNGHPIPFSFIEEWVSFDPPRLHIGDSSLLPMPTADFQHDTMAVRLRVVSDTEMHVAYMRFAGKGRLRWTGFQGG